MHQFFEISISLIYIYQTLTISFSENTFHACTGKAMQQVTIFLRVKQGYPIIACTLKAYLYKIRYQYQYIRLLPVFDRRFHRRANIHIQRVENRMV